MRDMFLIFAFFVFGLEVTGQDKQIRVRREADEYFARIADRQPLTRWDDETLRTSAATLITKAEDFTTHPNVKVRFHAYALLSKVGLFSAERATRKVVTEHLIIASSDSEQLVRESALRYMLRFHARDFQTGAGQVLWTQFRQGPNHELTRLLGLLSVREALPDLQRLGKRIGPFGNAVTYTLVSWDAQLACARMGDATALNLVLSGFQKRGEASVPMLLMDLAYVGSNRTLAVIDTYLNNNGVFAGNGSDVVNIRHEQMALHALATHLEGFPVKSGMIGGYSSYELDTARDWMRQRVNKEPSDR